MRHPSKIRRATIHRVILAAIALLAPVTASAQKLITPGYQFNSDPSCREIDGRFYLFTTHDPFTVQFEKPNPKFKGMYDIHAYSTADFDNWVDHGSLLNTHDAGWHKGNAVWDGDAGIPANGKYYAYIPFRVNADSEDNYGHFQIGVFVADRIEGPYSDALGRPLTTFDGKAIFGLSPTVVYADDGDPYLIWGPDVVPDTVRHTVSLARLKPNMTGLAEPAHDIAVETINKCGSLEYFESPVLFKHGDLWYLTYVGFKSWAGKRNCNYSDDDPPGCYIQYATSKSMFGPFNENIRHFIYPVSGGDLNTQQGICQYRGEWYVAYHTSYQNIHRQACVTHLRFNPDGSLVPIHPDSDQGAGTPGVSRLTLDAYANKREAEEFYARLNADDENGILGDYHFKMKDGGYLRFDRMDFGDGAAGFKVEVSCESPNLKGGRLEFRLDNPCGRKVGEAFIACTKGNTNYVVLTGPVSGAIGIHDVCLVAHGAGGDDLGHLFNVNWFTFTRTYRPEPKAMFAVGCGCAGEDGLSPDQAYSKGGWGFEGDTRTGTTNAVIYYNCNLPNALRTHREAAADQGSFRYKFTAPDGEYVVQLLFAEPAETDDNPRRFDVTINGRRALSDFDILAAAGGPNRVAMREFAGIAVNDGMIEIEFVSKAKAAMVNAIRIYAADAGAK